MKQLPSIYKKEIKNNTNNTKVAHLKNEEEFINNTQIILQKLFQNEKHTHNVPVIIKTKKEELETLIIARNKKSIFTIKNEEIPIKEIISIQIKN